MKAMKNSAVVALVVLLCTVVFGGMFTSCENGIDGEPTFTASVKKEYIKVPIEVHDTIWNTVYDTTTVIIRDTVDNTIIVRDSIIVIKHDTTEIKVEVIKKEGLEKNGEPGLEKIDDKSYLTWYPLIEDGNPIEPATELNVRANIEDCDHDIIVVKSAVIGAPAFYAQKSTRQYQDGDFTKLEFKATWTYNFGSFTEKVNTVHEAAWYKGWQMLSSYWTGGLKDVKYGEGVAYTYEGIEGTLYENTLTWEFTYNENDVRTFTKTHRFFVPAEGGDTPEDPTEKKLTGYEEKEWDGNNSYIIRHFYDDGTYEDIPVSDNLPCTGSVEVEQGSRIFRNNISFGNPTITKNGEATKEGSSSTNNNITRQGMVQQMTAFYDGYSHNMSYHYTTRSYSKGGLAPIQLSVPMWTLNLKQTIDGTVRQEVEDGKNYDVTPMTFLYSTTFGTTAKEDKNHNFEVWKYTGDEVTVTGIRVADFGLEFRSNTTSYAYAEFYSLFSDGTEKLLGKDGVEIYNSVEVPATQDVESADFNVVDAQPVAGSKVFVSSREVACKFGGKFLISKYRTLYTTKTNKASVVFTAYHEEVAYVPEKGNKVSDSAWEKEYSFVDNGSSSLVDLGRENGKDGKMYKSQISATYNGHATDAAAQVNVWVASPNQFGIASGAQSHTWDYNNAHHVATIFTYNIYENGQLIGGGLKGYIDGKEVTKKTWSEVTVPANAVLGLAQKANGEWVICRTYQNGDAFMWRSIENASNNSPITSIEANQVRVANNGKAELYIASTYTENADGSVTVSSAEGSATAAAW